MMKFLCIIILVTSPAWAFHDSFHAVAKDAFIESGVIYTKSQNDSEIIKEIRAQLQFMVGFFNYYDSSPDFKTLSIEIVDKEEINLSIKISYKAKFVLSLHKKFENLNGLELIMPEQGNQRFLHGPWYDRYGDPSERNPNRVCLLDNTKKVYPSNHWYHYRPWSDGCALKDRVSGANDLAVSFNVFFQESQISTEGKSPEYDRLWEDDQLKVVLVHGKTFPFQSPPLKPDPGVQSFNEGRKLLKNIFSETEQSESIDDLNNTYQLDFYFRDGRSLRIDAFLIDDILKESHKIEDDFNELSFQADVIIYSGHAGLGLNTEKISSMGKFQKGKYQIYMIDGCNTYSHLSTTLQKRREEVNPEESFTKYLDLILDARPGTFEKMYIGHAGLIKSLVERSKTYREILEDFPEEHMAVVLGEEDNP